MQRNNLIIIKLITFCFLFNATNGMSQTDATLRNYSVGEFNKIVARGGGNLQIAYADSCTVRVRNNNSCFKIEEISVSSKTLHIRIKNSDEGPCDDTIFIGMPALDEIAQKGGGSIVLKEGFPPTDSFQCKINGGGKINVSKLRVASFDASINGGGHILLHAEKELRGNISGGGLIEYTGDPDIKRSVSGGGTIKKK